VVSGGFVEVNSDSASILAEQAFEKSKVSRDTIESLIADAEKFLENAGTEAKDSADKRLADTKLLIELLNI
jgi:F0F1-type ATP synthase epsilon subunit